MSHVFALLTHDAAWSVTPCLVPEKLQDVSRRCRSLRFCGEQLDAEDLFLNPLVKTRGEAEDDHEEAYERYHHGDDEPYGNKGTGDTEQDVHCDSSLQYV